jgi:ABC-type branched-subunit amino acid transport system ATPase component
MSVAPSPLLSVRGCRVRFGGLVALDGVDLEVGAGEIVAVIGPNGAGKSSLFNAITGLAPMQAGDIRLAGRPLVRPLSGMQLLLAAGLVLGAALAALVVPRANTLWQAAITDHQQPGQAFPWRAAGESAIATLARSPGWTLWLPALSGAALAGLACLSVWRAGRRTSDVVARAGIGRTFQNIRLFPSMTAREQVLIGMDHHLQRVERGHAHLTADAILDRVGLLQIAEQPAGSLPYGIQRRLEIARALAGEPRLLLLDEPAAGMNPTESEALMALIRRIRADGVAILIIEHDMRVVMGISDRIVVLDHGRCIAAGPPEAIRRDPQVIAAYLGSEAAS